MTFKRCNVSDLVDLRSLATQRTITDQGYLIAPANLSSAGNVQEYFASELGMDTDGADPRRIVRMYRPSDEVFAPDALRSFEALPITLGHPHELVTADNWKKYSIGEATGMRPDDSGKHMAGRLTIRDKAGIDAVLDGTSQMSCGYSFDPDMQAGQTADGRAYDGSMRNIRGNHHAIVDAARGGPGCRIADRQPQQERADMATIKKTIDGVTFEFADESQASMVEKLIADARIAAKAASDSATAATARATDAESALADEKTKGAKLVADNSAEIAALKAQIPTAEQLAALDTVAKTATAHAAEVARLKALVPTAEKIEKLAAEYARGVADAKKVIPTFDAEGKTLPGIRTEVLELVIASNDSLKHIANAALGGTEPSKAADDLVRIAFDSVVAAKGISGANDDAAEGSVNDPAVARQLLGDRNVPAAAGGRRKPVSGYDLMRFRERNGGKDPNKATA